MELAFAAALIIAIIVGTLALIVGVPLVFGIMAYDIVQSRKTETATANAPVKDAATGIAVKRGIARAFVVVGSVFWSIATFAELYSLRQTGVGDATLAAFIPLGASLATLVIGWYWERFTAALLMVGAVAAIAWGVIYQFNPTVWAIVTFSLIGPMLTASVLFWQARRDQEAYERATSLSPKLAFIFAARSTLGS
jgi:hypothetical protein